MFDYSVCILHTYVRSAIWITDYYRNRRFTALLFQSILLISIKHNSIMEHINDNDYGEFPISNLASIFF